MHSVITQFKVGGLSMILDKSAYQSISKKLMDRLSRYFTIVVPPILVREILGDLKKETSDGALNEKQVRDLSKKMPIMDSTINAHYLTIIHAELHGLPIPSFSKVDAASIQCNYQQIKQEVQDIIESEMEQIVNDPARAHLMVKK